MNSSAAKRLLERLPKVRGELEENAPLDRETWFRAGGPADVLFRPADRDDLIAFIQKKPKDVPVTVIGYGSNLLVYLKPPDLQDVRNDETLSPLLRSNAERFLEVLAGP